MYLCLMEKKTPSINTDFIISFFLPDGMIDWVTTQVVYTPLFAYFKIVTYNLSRGGSTSILE